MKKNLILSVLIVLLTTSYSLKSQNLVVKNQSKSSLTLRLIIDNYDIKEIHEGNETMHEVALNSITIPNDKGKPNLPSVNRFIAIPNNAKAKVVVNNCKKEIIQDINIAPSRGIVSEYDTTNTFYIKDADIYSKDELFPADVASITEHINLRGVEAVGLNISPIQYNPVKKELVVYTEIELTIEFEGENRSFGDDRLRSMHWDPILQHNILNYNSLPEIDYASRMQRWIADDAEGAEYIIIIPGNDEFREQAQRLADYRSKQGIITKVYSINDIDIQSHDELRDWFIDAYNNWEIAPVAICMLGDYSTHTTDGLPAFIIDFSETAQFISDRPYSDINDDLLPDMAISRLSASNADEARIMIDKQINYEFTNPVMDESFYDEPIMTYSYQASKWFQICAESLIGHLQLKGKNPYRYNMILFYDDEFNDHIWSTADNTEQVINYFGPDGLGYIPEYPYEVGEFPEFNYDESHLVQKISEEPGYILLNRDHGWFTGWTCPPLSSNSLRNLTNYGKLPFVFSINCATGAFNQTNCMAETFMKSENTGAVGIIATTYESHTYTNDSYLWGAWDFFHNDFLPDYGTTTDNNNNYMPAFANVSAKHFIYQMNFPNTYENTRELTSNLYHAFCDAFLKLYSEVPQQMDIEHDYSYNNVNKEFNIKAPVGSMIAISINESGKIKTLSITEGTGNMQTIDIPFDINPDIDMYVTVTKSNHLRYEQDIIVTTDKAYVTMMDFNLYEGSHDIISNESTDIDLLLKNIGNDNSSTINLSLSCDSDKINITNNSNVTDGLSVDETINLENAFHLEVMDGIENGSVITFTLNIEHDGMIHEEEFHVNVHSYNFEIVGIFAEEHEGNGNSLIDPNEFATIILTIENTGSFAMDDIVANLTTNNEYISVVSKNVAVDHLEIGENASIEFKIYIKWNIEPEPIAFHLELNVGNCKVTKNFNKTLGSIIENFENGIIENNLWKNDKISPWLVDNTTAHESSYSLRSGKIDDEESTSISITLDNPTELYMSFYYKVSTENGWDFFYFSIDGEKKIEDSGEKDWKLVKFLIPAGTHTYTWTYIKDLIFPEGNDCVWIDDITFPSTSFTDTEEINEKNIRIYPNPADDFVNIEMTDDDNNSDFSVSIYNSIGVKVIETNNEHNIDIEHLSSGLYLINIHRKEKTFIKKIIVK